MPVRVRVSVTSKDSFTGFCSASICSGVNDLLSWRVFFVLGRPCLERGCSTWTRTLSDSNVISPLRRESTSILIRYSVFPLPEVMSASKLTK